MNLTVSTSLLKMAFCKSEYENSNFVLTDG